MVEHHLAKVRVARSVSSAELIAYSKPREVWVSPTERHEFDQNLLLLDPLLTNQGDNSGYRISGGIRIRLGAFG